MSLSKEQAACLKLVQQDGKAAAREMYNSENKIFQDLYSNNFFNSNMDVVNGELEVVNLSLSAKGQKELSLYIENKRAEFKSNFVFPLLVSISSAIVGALITYLLMKLKVIKLPRAPPITLNKIVFRI